MRYVYRDPERLRGRPVHVPEDAEPAAAPAATEPQPEAAPAPACRRPKPARPKKNPRPLPPPVWGGAAGLFLAAAESADLDRRTEILIEAGQTSEWIREYQRSTNPK